MFYRTFLASALVAGAQAAYLNNELSFGHNGDIPPNRQRREVPNYQLLGSPNLPEVLSNKVVLTAPAPGNQRGAVWSDKALQHSAWAADIDFRATGPERAGGNLQIWYANKGKDDIGSSSIYTVGKFDGLALVVDQYSGTGGFIRGFLNDGSTDYKSHHSVDSLAFGHCEYSYRNLGRPTQISIKQTSSKFSVEVDGKPCFDSPKIKLPLGYNFGISAASAENPDSFEVFKLVVTTENLSPDGTPGAGPQGQNAAANKGQQARSGQSPNDGSVPAFADPPEVPAESIKTSEAQFADLHNRLQMMMKNINVINRDILHQQDVSSQRHNTINDAVTRLEQALSKLGSLASLEQKINDIAQDVKQTKADMHTALDKHVAGLRSEVRDNHGRVLGTIASSAPGILGYVFVVLGSQALLVLAYVLYKRRKANGPKKYL